MYLLYTKNVSYCFAGDVKVTQETERKSNTVKATQAAKTNVKVKENVKKIEDEADKKLKKGDVEVSDNMQKRDSQAKRKGKRGLDKKVVVDTGVNRSSPPSSPIRSTEHSTTAGIKGKVQDFVKMFNHEVHSTPQEGESRSKSFKWKASSNIGVESEKSYSMPKANEKVQLPKFNKTQDATPNVPNFSLVFLLFLRSSFLGLDFHFEVPTRHGDSRFIIAPLVVIRKISDSVSCFLQVDQNLNNQEKTTKYSKTKTPTPQAKDYSDQKAAPSTNGKL